MAGVDEAKKAGFFQGGERLLHAPFVIRNDRVAIRRLVARQDQCVEGQRILLGSRELLLRQTADHPGFDWIQFHEGASLLVSASRAGPPVPSADDVGVSVSYPFRQESFQGCSPSAL